MTCDECRERLQELVDDELVPRERKAIEAHLSGCPTCTQEHRDLAHFTTSVAQAVRPIRPSAELSSKVLTVYHESREKLQAAPAPAPERRGPIPTWAWWTGIGVLALSGLVVLLWPSAPGTVGRIKEGTVGVRVLTYGSGGWTPAGRTTLRTGDRVEATESETGPCALRLSGWGDALLHVPCIVRIERADETLALRLLQEAPNRIDIQTQTAASAAGRRLRIAWGSAWVELNADERNDVTVEPLSGEGGGWTGQLRASVKKGAARLGNTGEPQTVGEGFSRVIPQNGECEAARKIE